MIFCLFWFCFVQSKLIFRWFCIYILRTLMVGYLIWCACRELLFCLNFAFTAQNTNNEPLVLVNTKSSCVICPVHALFFLPYYKVPRCRVHVMFSFAIVSFTCLNLFLHTHFVVCTSVCFDICDGGSFSLVSVLSCVYCICISQIELSAIAYSDIRMRHCLLWYSNVWSKSR